MKMSSPTRSLTAGVIIGLVIGLILGYAITGSNTSKLEQQIGQLEEQVKDLQNQLTSKYNQILELQNQLADKETEISNLQNQISILKSQLAEKIKQIDELQSQLKILNAPISNFTTINDLEITITTHKHVYIYKEPISGNVTIYYINGTAFKGSFSIYIERLEGGMVSGHTFPVDGYGEFYVKTPAFSYGPGKYRIGILVLYDAEGFVIAHSRDYFPYVKVEAK